MDLNISTVTRTSVIITFILYTVGMLVIGFIAKKRMDRSSVDKYVEDFYTGGRGMGSLVVALMIAAGISSAGTFIGGPGLCYSLGFAFFMAGAAQVFMNFQILGQLGKKMGIVARRINAQSFVDLLVSRYNKNKVIGIASVLVITIFFGSYVVSQFVGGARLFESMTGLPYWLGLLMFGLVILVTAAFGGIRGVSISVVVQGLIMTIAVFTLFIGAFKVIGPIKPAIDKIIAIEPNMANPFSFSMKKMISYWILMGLSCIALPHGVMSTITYRDTRAMHKAILIGIFFVIVWGLPLTLIGIFGRAVFPNISVPDQIIPIFTLKTLPPWLAGMTLAGVAGAIQSTVGAMLIVISSTFVRNTYKAYINKNADSKKLKKVTLTSTIIMCVIVFLFALNPPKSLQFIILFSIGGMASGFFWPILLGLYWMRANEYGAAAGMISGVLAFGMAGLKPAFSLGMHPIVVALIVSGIITVVVSLITPKTPKGIILTWFSDKYPKEIA